MGRLDKGIGTLVLGGDQGPGDAPAIGVIVSNDTYLSDGKHMLSA
jgi:hypothetical protein